MTRTVLVLLAAALAASPARAEQLGRLFFTAEQRAALDARRNAHVPDNPSAPTATSPVTRVDGYVKRSQGPSTVWINGETVPATGSGSARIDERSGEGRVTIDAPEGRNRPRLKPGQSLDRATGEVHDVLGDGELEVHRGRQGQ